MMAKDRDNRYRNVDELLADLESLREGKPPIQAHRKFDVTALEELEAGEKVEMDERAYDEETIAHYRMAILILSAAAAIFLIIILLMLVLRH